MTKSFPRGLPAGEKNPVEELVVVLLDHGMGLPNAMNQEFSFKFCNESNKEFTTSFFKFVDRLMQLAIYLNPF